MAMLRATELGSAASAKRFARSIAPFLAPLPILWLIHVTLGSAPGWEYAFQNINHIGIAIILAVSLNLVNGLTG